LTPFDQERDDGKQALGAMWREPEAALRRQHVRRRVAAAGALFLLIAWLTGLGGPSSGSRAPASTSRLAAGIGGPAALETRQLVAEAADYERQRRAITNVLSYTSFVTAGGRSTHEVALTFDDGPGPYTPKIVDILTRLHVPATFFVVGRELRYFGLYLPRELAHGFVIGDHTQDHVPLGLIEPAAQRSQLLEQAAGIARWGAPFPHLFRPPYGSYSAATLGIAKQLGMLTVLWTIDTKDFARPGVKVIVANVLSGVRPGAIVLLHDAGGERSQTIAALPLIIRRLQKRGYQLVTVPRLLADDPPPRSQQPPPTNLSGG
jgi:peptidoglycan/xylan/chitin deacetylase (PgdA/CDA1 family)